MQALHVSGAFHSQAMAPAADRLAEALASVTWRDPHCAIYSNVTGTTYSPDGEGWRELLVRQLTEQVRWHTIVQHVVATQPCQCIEVGPGDTMRATVRRVHQATGLATRNVGGWKVKK